METLQFENKPGESKKCIIQYGNMKAEVPATIMYNLGKSINIKMTYFRDVALLTNFINNVTNQMLRDGDEELNEKNKKDLKNEPM